MSGTDTLTDFKLCMGLIRRRTTGVTSGRLNVQYIAIATFSSCCLLLLRISLIYMHEQSHNNQFFCDDLYGHLITQSWVLQICVTLMYLPVQLFDVALQSVR